jgi:hypothetical protein
MLGCTEMCSQFHSFLNMEVGAVDFGNRCHLFLTFPYSRRRNTRYIFLTFAVIILLGHPFQRRWVENFGM